jgi:hypothetical protein
MRLIRMAHPQEKEKPQGFGTRSGWVSGRTAKGRIQQAVYTKRVDRQPLLVEILGGD